MPRGGSTYITRFCIKVERESQATDEKPSECLTQVNHKSQAAEDGARNNTHN
ncbi:hypothetical protein HMPREF3204_00627 [Gardnerella pickettii]|nr:hypothetical protein HMPREF3204_00627 [Gardnerella pickettii]